MESQGTVYAYRKKRNPIGDDKFIVFDFGDADLTNESWKSDAETNVFFETRGVGIGDVFFMWKNKHA